MRFSFLLLLFFIIFSALGLRAEELQPVSNPPSPDLETRTDTSEQLDDQNEAAALIAEARTSLTKNSPFGGNEQTPRVEMGPKVPARYELHGIMNLDGKWQFSLYDPKAKVSQWISSNDPNAPIKILNFNQQKNSVTIMDNGQVQELVLKKPDMSSGGYTPPSSPFSGSGSSSAGYPSKEEFMDLMLGKKKLDDKFKNPPSSRTRPEDLDELEKILSSKLGKMDDLDDEDEDYED